jgi:hypothetical protein
MADDKSHPDLRELQMQVSELENELEARRLQMRITELKDALAKLHVSEDEIKGFHKVAEALTALAAAQGGGFGYPAYSYMVTAGMWPYLGFAPVPPCCKPCTYAWPSPAPGAVGNAGTGGGGVAKHSAGFGEFGT